MVLLIPEIFLLKFKHFPTSMLFRPLILTGVTVISCYSRQIRAPWGTKLVPLKKLRPKSINHLDQSMLTAPDCDDLGLFKSIQCSAHHCCCVDKHSGQPIKHTTTSKSQRSNLFCNYSFPPNCTAYTFNCTKCQKTVSLIWKFIDYYKQLITVRPLKHQNVFSLLFSVFRKVQMHRIRLSHLVTTIVSSIRNPRAETNSSGESEKRGRVPARFDKYFQLV